MNRRSSYFIFILFFFCFFIIRPTLANWTAISPGANGTIHDFCIYNNELYVCGEFTQIGGITANRIASWDGSTWKTIQGITSGKISDMEVYGGSLYVSGEFSQIGSLSVKNIAKWDGNAWSDVGGGISRTGGESGDGVGNVLKVYNNALYVGGWIDYAGVTPVNHIAKWDGTNWSAPGTGVDNIVSALEVYNNELYVGGSFSHAGSIISSSIAKWNNTYWSAVGNGTNGYVEELTTFNGDLILSGDFTQAGGIAAIKIARWNGTSFYSLGTGVTGGDVNTMPYSLTVYNNKLYAGGYFQTMGGISASNIASWDGSNWTALGSGISNSTANLSVVACMIEYKEELFVGGMYDLAGGLTSNNISKWSELPTSILTSSQVLSIQVFPNPVQSNEPINIKFSQIGETLVRVVDVLGKELYSENKNNSIVTPIEVYSPNLSKGIYYLYINSQGNQEVVPFVVQ